MPTEASLALTEALLIQFPGLRAVFAVLAVRWKRTRRLPRSVTSNADAETVEGLRRLFPSRFVTALDGGRVRIDVGGFLRTGGAQGENELVALVFAVLGQNPGVGSDAERASREGLERGFSRLAAEAESIAARAFVAAALRELGAPASEWSERAKREGLDRTLHIASSVVRCLNALTGVIERVRIQNFSARVLGSSKVLRPGSDLFRTLAAALLDHDPKTRRTLEEQDVPPHRPTQISAALDVHGVYHDQAAASVLCFGPLMYEKRGHRFDHVARHATFGESGRLITQQLRDASIVEPAARRVTVFENLTPYLDYVEACVSRNINDEIVLCSSGQASWAVVLVLSGLARFELAFRHCGDLDRAGVMILRSLRDRSGAKLVPLLMDVATFNRFANRGQPVSVEERRRLAQRIEADPPDALGRELLGAISDRAVWVEQEAFAEECLEEMLR